MFLAILIILRKNYGAKGKYINCLPYPSLTFDKSVLAFFEKYEKNSRGGKIKILVGNSGWETNEHFFVFKKLSEYLKGRKDIVEIICPLSYGDRKYIESVVSYGKSTFGNNFVPLLNFINLKDYLKLLFSIDIAILYNNRQEGMGNLIWLLGFGKKVYLRRSTPQWELFSSLGIKVFDFDNDFNLDIFDDELKKNSEIIQKFFSLERLKKDWERIFYYE